MAADERIVFVAPRRINQRLKRFVNPRHVFVGARICADVWVVFLRKTTIRFAQGLGFGTWTDA
jgi:hypothetical protein